MSSALATFAAVSADSVVALPSARDDAARFISHPDPAHSTLSEPEWQARRLAHEARVRAWTDPHQARAAAGRRHPVCDFLFTYYSFRPAWLRRWHPGPRVVLQGAAAREFLRRPEYRETAEGVALNLGADAVTPERRRSVGWMRDLLAVTAERPPVFGCHGLHEWAMLYQQGIEEVRHQGWPLRFSLAEIREIVAANPPRCTHFDAFRHFAPAAQPLNRWSLSRDDIPAMEQRGCLHANMDLYKWAFKLTPFTPSELTADCFALARDIREIDMRASPYDFRALGYAPIAIETPEGRAEYEAYQRAFAERSQPLRAGLIALGERLLAG